VPSPDTQPLTSKARRQLTAIGPQAAELIVETREGQQFLAEAFETHTAQLDTLKRESIGHARALDDASLLRERDHTRLSDLDIKHRALVLTVERNSDHVRKLAEEQRAYVDGADQRLERLWRQERDDRVTWHNELLDQMALLRSEVDDLRADLRRAQERWYDAVLDYLSRPLAAVDAWWARRTR
jgi:hypothetical protein